MPGRQRAAQRSLIENKGVRYILIVNIAKGGHAVRALWTKIVILDRI
jgi:hypothetical protein